MSWTPRAASPRQQSQCACIFANPRVHGARCLPNKPTPTVGVLSCFPKPEACLKVFTALLSTRPPISARKESRASTRSSKLRFRSGAVSPIFIFRCSSIPTAIPPIEEAERMVKLAENRYGKSRVRLVRVRHRDGWHELSEWTIQVLLQGDFESCFTDGGNSKILPTDTMKNTVDSLARNSSAGSIEDFGKELAAFLLGRNPQVSAAEVAISETPWDHVVTQGNAHPAAFLQSTRELQTTTVTERRDGRTSVVSGLDDLVILKTAGSAFTGYIKDPLT